MAQQGCTLDKIAGKPSGNTGKRMRAGRPRSRVVPFDPCSVCSSIRGGSFEGKPQSSKKDEPRMNTNSHEYGWTRSNDQRHRNASATLIPCNDFVDNPSISMVTPANRQPRQSVYWCSFVSIGGSPFSLASRRGKPQRLGGPSSFFVVLRGQLFFGLLRLCQESPEAALNKARRASSPLP